MVRVLRSLAALALMISLAPVAIGVAGTSPPGFPPTSCPEVTPPADVPMDAMQEAIRRYAGVPGFVDLESDPSDPSSVVALFDLEHAARPLPAGDRIGDLTIRVEGARFEPLIAPRETAADPPLIPAVCTNRISPGVSISTPVGGCSLNFIFTASGNTYAGTAGHCFSANNQRMSVGGLGQVGTVVYFLNAGIGNDFALVRIDANKVSFVNAAMCHWGGPTASADGELGGVVRHYGYGIGYGSTQFTRPRTGYQIPAVEANAFSFFGAVTSGDSGSGARQDEGPAIGLVTHVKAGVPGFIGHSAPHAYGTRVARAVSLAEAATGLDLTLVTAPVA